MSEEFELEEQRITVLTLTPGKVVWLRGILEECLSGYPGCDVRLHIYPDGLLAAEAGCPSLEGS